MTNGKIDHLRARLLVEANRRGLSLSELARRIGKSPTGLQDVLKRGDPKASMLKALADALEVPVDRLYEPVSPAEYGSVMAPRRAPVPAEPRGITEAVPTPA